MDGEGRWYGSSRFEGRVYGVHEDGTVEPFASDLGVACGLAFAADGTLFVGDRSGTLFRVDKHGKASAFASMPASVAAFHLAIGPDAAIYVTAPTLSTYHPAFPVSPPPAVTTIQTQFPPPQRI